MIVPDPRSGFPLTGNLIQPKIPPVYGPGVPEFQETIQIRARLAPSGGRTGVTEITRMEDDGSVSARLKSTYVGGRMTKQELSLLEAAYEDITNAEFIGFNLGAPD